ncbi:uncharacterized protein LOC123310436 [Coccinella septempunctata]|uniref:uncharacterized protein LOC123310436 n=1 Tax=Coccinella septempunctata TaxID=41139 RepID=UPI001D0698BD|nr:uncharacterized protein LOC123310436 [Coccinella septempunctata]
MLFTSWGSRFSGVKMFLPTLVIFFAFYSEINAVPSTNVHQIKLPTSKSVKIFEDDPSWANNDRQTNRNPNRSTDRADTTGDSPTSDENFDQYALERFLNTYAEKFRKKHHPNSINTRYEDDNNQSEEDQRPASSNDKEEKSKNWNMMQVQKHKHPFEDKNGWVSMDPVPWSLSKISKWHSEKKPMRKPEVSYEALETPLEADLETSGYDDIPSKPSWYHKPRPYKIKPSTQYKPVTMSSFNEDQNEEDNFYQMNRPTIVVQEPEFTEPGSYEHKVQIHYNTDSSHYQGNKHFIKRPTYQTHRYDTKTHKNCDHSAEEIITDGQPSNFPSNRRKSSEIPETHPFTGNGDWILLSTTKGYKSPKTRQRSLQISLNPKQTSVESTRKSIQVFPNLIPSKTNNKLNDEVQLDQKEPDSIGLRRGVQLTVLPPLKNSKINMTTSHGGLLQVESTFETVEQAQKRQARKVLDNFRKKPIRTKIGKGKVIRRPAVQKLNVALPVTSLNERIGSPDISAVLAAAGAGMIPATMAMLVPMAMGGKRRRRDLTYHHRPGLPNHTFQ